MTDSEALGLTGTDAGTDTNALVEPAGDPGDEELPPLRQSLEALLLVSDAPLVEVTLAQVLERPTREVHDTLHALAAEYDAQQRGFQLRQVASGWRMSTRRSCAPYVERFVLTGQSARLSRAALETLAIVAYRQPVTRGQVAAIRGVSVDGVLRTLALRGMVEEAGTEAGSGATLYRTTATFLERLGLAGLEELPPLAPLLPRDADDEHLQRRLDPAAAAEPASADPPDR